MLAKEVLAFVLLHDSVTNTPGVIWGSRGLGVPYMMEFLTDLFVEHQMWLVDNKFSGAL